MRFGSVCSGIEAASVAWHSLGWQAAWLAEIEPFPSAVLKHHYHEVPNLGDMTTLPNRIRAGEVEAPDLFCGGTPCQAFSVAGLRQSLADARGNLSLTFCEIANVIDSVRSVQRQQPSIVFWENVPGVLSTSDNAFGCFLGALSGMSKPLDAPDEGWTSAGCVSGPQRTVAWRILDAQYFGLAQRRRRVFVVASARADFDPAAVLFEWDGVRRDTAPSREAGKVAPTIPSRSTAGGGLGTDFDLDGGVVQQPYAVANCLTARMHKGINSTLDEGQTPVVQPVAFDTTQITSAANYSNPKPGDPRHPLAAGAHPPAIAFHPTQDPISSTDGSTHCLGTGSKQGGATVAVAFGGDISRTLQARHDSSPCADRGMDVVAIAMQVRRLTPTECERLQGFSDNYTMIPWRGKPADQCPDGPRYKALGNSWAVPVVRWIGQRIQHASANGR